MNIPFIWEPEEIDGEKYVDGCMAKNIPLDVFDADNQNTVGFSLIGEGNRVFPEDFGSYLKKIITCLLHRSNQLELHTYRMKGYTIVDIPTYHVGAMSMNVDKSSIEILVNNTYNKYTRSIQR
jgi:predicted acylesterase/phospholipase RssA